MKTDLLPFLNLTFLNGQEGIGRDRKLIVVFKETDVRLLNNSLPVCKKKEGNVVCGQFGTKCSMTDKLLLNSI